MRKRSAAAIALLMLAAAGCNQIFGLEPPGGGDDDVPSDGRDPEIDGPPDDVDSDGVRNGVDNCPDVYNPSQSDSDGDAEINGGDACDICPHRGSVPAGQPHANLDLDELGDDCDPNPQVRHCLRWFDGFSDGTPAEIMARYQLFGSGQWSVDSGTIRQTDSSALSAGLAIAGETYQAPVVVTDGVMDVLPTAQTGGVPYRNLAGVFAAYDGKATGTCFGSISRDISTSVPGPAESTIAYNTMVTEIVTARTGFAAGGNSMVAGQRFGVTYDSANAPDMPSSTGVLFDQGSAAQATGMLACTSGTAGVRTSFAAITFDHLLVIEAEPPEGCPPRGPPLAPP